MKNLKEQLERYQRRVKKWQRTIIKIKKGSQKGQFDKEQNTVIKFVLPLLDILGWNRLYTEMDFEYPVTKTRRVDIALYTKDPKKAKSPKTIVEVKPINGKELSDGRQLFGYLKEMGLNYGIYTNGKEIKLIGKYRIKGKPVSFFHLCVDDFVRYSDILRLLSKQSFKKDFWDRFAKGYQEHFTEWKECRKVKKRNKRTEDELQLLYVRERAKNEK